MQTKMNDPPTKEQEINALFQMATDLGPNSYLGPWRGDKSTARPRVLEDLRGWSSMLRMFDGEAIGTELQASRGTAWGAYQAVTEFITHESGKSKDPTEAARKRLESMWWGQGYKAISIAHEKALSIS